MNIREASKYIADKDLVRASSGNISECYPDRIVLIKVSGAWMELAKSNDFIMIDLEGRKISNNSFNPSSEWKLHTEVYKIRKDVSVVLHCQSPNATALCCNTFLQSVDFNVIPEVPAYCKKVSTIGYYNPGSQDLALAVAEAVKDSDVVMMANHGQVVIGKDFEDVIQKALFLELACGILLSGNIKSLNEKEIEYIKDYKK